MVITTTDTTQTQTDKTGKKLNCSSTCSNSTDFLNASSCTHLFIYYLFRDRHRPDHQSGSDPRSSQRAVRPPQWDEVGQGRPQQQPRGQEPSRAHRERPGSGPPPPPHRDREPRNRDQVGTKRAQDPALVYVFRSNLSFAFPTWKYLVCQVTKNSTF